MATVTREKDVVEEKENKEIREEEIANAIANESKDSNGELGSRESIKKYGSRLKWV